MTKSRKDSDANLERMFEDRTRELKDAREEQAAASEILRIISSAPTDLQTVFNAIANSAARLCDAYDIMVFRVDGDVLRLVGHSGPMDVGDVPILHGTIGGRAVLEQRMRAQQVGLDERS